MRSKSLIDLHSLLGLAVKGNGANCSAGPVHVLVYTQELENDDLCFVPLTLCSTVEADHNHLVLLIELTALSLPTFRSTLGITAVDRL
jgi:hypothetical protein